MSVIIIYLNDNAQTPRGRFVVYILYNQFCDKYSDKYSPVGNLAEQTKLSKNSTAFMSRDFSINILFIYIYMCASEFAQLVMVFVGNLACQQ